MSDKRSDWVYDELMCFLGSAFFQIPVSGFIEVKCLSKYSYLRYVDLIFLHIDVRDSMFVHRTY